MNLNQEQDVAYLMFDGWEYVLIPVRPSAEGAEKEAARAEGGECERPVEQREAYDQSDRTSDDEGPPDA